MDKLAKYREYIKTLLTRYTSDDISDNEVEVQLILDTERYHYRLDRTQLTLICIA